MAALAGCGRKAPAPETPAAKPDHAAAAARHLPAGIDWYPGGVDAAFDAAKTSSKPLFLYWGAEWCPPCAQIKATIFSRREFQERSRLFVPVYLDGDTPSAQKYGEQFGIVGYPTMILFRPDGTEITRLPGGVDIRLYAKILDVALAGARPVADILAAARQGGETSTERLEAARVLRLGHGQRPRPAAGRANRHLPPAGSALPGGNRGRLLETVLRVPLVGCA